MSWAGRPVLVTGGAGFIGSHIVDALLADGARVVVLDDLSTGAVDNLPAGARLVVADIASPATARLVARERPALVIHAAAHVSVPASVRDPSRDREVNLVGTQHVLDGAREASVSRFVFIFSGGAVYGEAHLATEEALPRPISPYGVHKLAAESYVRLSGLPHGIVRFSNVYGPRQRAGLEGGVVATFVDAVRDGRLVSIHGSGRQVRDFLYVADAVDGTLVVAAADVSGTWNVGTGRPTSVVELLALTERSMGRRAAVRHEPPRPGDVQRSSLAIDRIASDLGWRPAVTLADGIDATVAWARCADATILSASRQIVDTPR